MAVDAFLQFTKKGDGSVDLEGETKDETIGKDLPGPKPFQIEDWNFGVSQTLNIGSASGGAGAGKANFEPFHVKKNIDIATPFLFKTCCVGGHYQDVILAVRRAGAGKANFEPFHVKKNIDIATPFLFKTCCVGGHYQDVILAVRRAGGTATQSGQIYLKFHFKLVAVANISWSHGDPSPSEEIDFEYGALKFEYYPQKQTGGRQDAPD